VRLDPTEEELFARVAELLARVHGYPRERITPATRLAEDAGMDGDDATEFFEAYARELGVDLAAYRWYRHFGPEACNPLWLLRRPWWLAIDKLPITAADLVDAAEVGRWLMRYPYDRLDRRGAG
jgi:acyl carrier protein